MKEFNERYYASRRHQFIDSLLSNEKISDESIYLVSEFLQEIALEFDTRADERLRRYFKTKNKGRLPRFLDKKKFYK
jgi:hypothetical protein